MEEVFVGARQYQRGPKPQKVRLSRPQAGRAGTNTLDAVAERPTPTHADEPHPRYPSPPAATALQRGESDGEGARERGRMRPPAKNLRKARRFLGRHRSADILVRSNSRILNR